MSTYQHINVAYYNNPTDFLKDDLLLLTKIYFEKTDVLKRCIRYTCTND